VLDAGRGFRVQPISDRQGFAAAVEAFAFAFAFAFADG